MYNVMRSLSKASKIWKEGDTKELIDRAWHQISKDVLPPIHSARKQVYQQIKNRPSFSEGRDLYPKSDTSSEWISHNEEWERVVHRFKHREALQNERALTVSDETQNLSDRVSWNNQSSLIIDVPPEKADRWVWLALDPDKHSWRDFRWEFDVSRKSDFRELQFGFRYNGFYNRHRFQHEYGKLRYEKVHNGAFQKHYQAEPFEMELGREYHFAIEAIGNWFTLTVDGEKIIEEIDFAGDFPRGSCAIILWEDGSEVPIQAEIRNIKVTELVS